MNNYNYSFLKTKRPLWHYIVFTVIVAAAMFALSYFVFMFYVSHGSTSEYYHFATYMPSEGDVSEVSMKKMMNPDREVRGVWIATVGNINFPSQQKLSGEKLKAELDDIINTVEAAGLNTIYFQVRPSSDALYNSRYFPISAFLTGSQEYPFKDGFDVFAYLVEQAHARDIAVHAWVNPLRITYGSAENPQHDVSVLGGTNPARVHPEWTVAYDDGKLYYNAGIPEVRKLIADGVAEIIEKYNVDGIVFDDYFYPYPVSGAQFDDGDAYLLYGADFDSIDDWRRSNVNTLVEDCYNAIKAVSEDCLFGVSPFGIWQNDDGKNGGSDTSGLSAYSEIYCDALAWVEGGYVDYIAPQLYWQFTTSAARFDTLVRWWSKKLEGTGVDLIVSHAAYRTEEWGSGSEIAEQIEFARSELSYKGSIMYGYDAVKNNVHGLADSLREIYDYEIIYTDIVSNEGSVSVTTPPSGSTVTTDKTYIIGLSDPSEALYMDNMQIGRTKRGYFSVYTSLTEGKNVFTFEHKGETYEYVLYYNTAGGGGNASPAVMDKAEVVSVYPKSNTALKAGEKIVLTAYAPAGSSVSANIGGESIKLYSSGYAPDKKDALYRETYTAAYYLPKLENIDEIRDLGEITFTAEYKGERYTSSGGNLQVLGDSAMIPIEVVNDESYLKIAPDSWYYDDYTPACAGMKDYALSLDNGYYHLRMGGYISEADVKVCEQVTELATVSAVSVVSDKDYTYINITADEKMPLNSYVESGAFVFTFYNTDAEQRPEAEIGENPLISDCTAVDGARENSYRYAFTLKDTDNFYGYKIYYTESGVTVRLINPKKLDFDSLMPLEGIRIILDAGHGGNDVGALGADSAYPEKVLNLMITKAAGERLASMGAEVIYTREDDSTVDIYDRLDFLNREEPDLCVSIHQNSIDYSSDITKIRGLLSLYYADSGKLLADCISSSTAAELFRYERDVTKQRLAMTRNHKFPSALVEVGFITSVEEYDTMINCGGTEAAAEGIVNGILEWYRIQSDFAE